MIFEWRRSRLWRDPERADATGLVAIGGDLSPERLLEAYRRGIFPWYDEELPICWWSPDPRAIFELDRFHVSRRLQRTCRSSRFQVSFDQAFSEVIRGCADRPGQGTWITSEMVDAYEALQRLGYAHSVEVWKENQLSGGIYGVAVGSLFAGESMFSRCTDASKVALVHLVDRLRERGFQLFDIQFLNAHTARLGAVEIPRTEYLARLRTALECQPTF
ncbi:MAG TPA: leucyl/phenylalanyl-tRNA--protein transferase [Gemmataceae bacterium]|jgi:leucyl/phenylalanyl-tRNA--protein transferase|nr:leucyl/phenylalanyl-tRNA--protein transferase [Gemmataceae bacterium]